MLRPRSLEGHTGVVGLEQADDATAKRHGLDENLLGFAPTQGVEQSAVDSVGRRQLDRAERTVESLVDGPETVATKSS